MTITVDRSDLLRGIKSVVTRAETKSAEAHHIDDLVPVIDFHDLSSLNTEIIYGRNGTGKTHLLKAFDEYTRDRLSSTDVLSVYVYFSKFDLDQPCQVSP
jgi:chromosomal replication initiation ATPase DnaA